MIMKNNKDKSLDTKLWLNYEEYQFNRFFNSNWYRMRDMKNKDVYTEFKIWLNESERK